MELIVFSQNRLMLSAILLENNIFNERKFDVVKNKRKLYTFDFKYYDPDEKQTAQYITIFSIRI